MGLYGACRRSELLNMKLDHIDNKGDILIVTVPETKNNITRTFTITNKTVDGLNLLTIYNKYISLRPTHTPHNRLFISYKNNKCTVQPIGKNTFSKIPGKIATFFKLPEPGTYTGHCFRRSSATLLANSGSDLVTLKKHGGWRSSAVAEGYIDDCLSNKINISQKILTNQEQQPNTSRKNATEVLYNSDQMNELPVSLDNSNTPTSSIEISHHTARTSNTYQMPINSGITIHNCAQGIVNINYYNK